MEVYIIVSNKTYIPLWKFWETFETILQPVMFLKMLFFHRNFLSYFTKSTKKPNGSRKLSILFKIFANPSQQVTLYHWNSCVLLIDKPNERRRFSTQWLVVMLLILTRIDYWHVKKSKWQWTFKSWIKLLIDCCFFQNIIKQVKNLIYQR